MVHVCDLIPFVPILTLIGVRTVRCDESLFNRSAQLGHPFSESDQQSSAAQRSPTITASTDFTEDPACSRHCIHCPALVASQHSSPG
jgi:hypothetical protein